MSDSVHHAAILADAKSMRLVVFRYDASEMNSNNTLLAAAGSSTKMVHLMLNRPWKQSDPAVAAIIKKELEYI